jgi:hypothetical protein
MLLLMMTMLSPLIDGMVIAIYHTRTHHCQSQWFIHTMIPMIEKQIQQTGLQITNKCIVQQTDLRKGGRMEDGEWEGGNEERVMTAMNNNNDEQRWGMNGLMDVT